MVTLKQENQWLGDKGSDKGDIEHSFAGRSYLDVYEPLFSKLRFTKFDLIEIGVHQGGSMRLWKRYFQQAQIHGIDINPETKTHEQDRVHITIGSQDDAAVLDAVSTRCPNLKIVIDDGSHLLMHMLVTFSHLWKHLQPGGIYVFEDVSTTYWGVDSGWPGMKYNTGPLTVIERSVFDSKILGWINDMDHLTGDVKGLHCYANLVILEKA